METIVCPYCGGNDYTYWAQELSFTAVRCKNCALIYVNPRPTLASINAAVESGVHGEETQHLDVKSRRVSSKVLRYQKIFARMFDDVWKIGHPLSWLDVGAGYGEVVEAVVSLAPSGSQIKGLEPMKFKAEQARSRGLLITEDYLDSSHPKVNIISAINVFSHIPDFNKFLSDVRSVLEPRGEIFIETGNLADLKNRDEFPGELGLPDHLVFTGESHLRGYIEQAGFETVRIEKIRIDNALYLVKNIAKRILGKPVLLRVPYTSTYRQLMVRARLR